MTLTLNKSVILDKILIPISRISDECSIKIQTGMTSAIVSDEGGHIMLYIKAGECNGIENDINLNFKDIRKVIKIFSCIEDSEFDVKVNDNASVISHKSGGMSFKLHLVNDNIIKRTVVNINKIESLVFETQFDLNEARMRDIIKGSVISQDVSKAYIYSDNGEIFFNITDMAIQDTDSLTFKISDEYEGDDVTDPIAFNLDIFRLISNIKNNKIRIKINNTFKIILFEIEDREEGVISKYILPAYTK